PNLAVRLPCIYKAQQSLAKNMNLFGIESALYMTNVILKPLTQELNRVRYKELRRDVLRTSLHSFLGDLLEALPYLWSSSRSGRYVFAVPGTTCVAAFRFIS